MELCTTPALSSPCLLKLTPTTITSAAAATTSLRSISLYPTQTSRSAACRCLPLLSRYRSSVSSVPRASLSVESSREGCQCSVKDPDGSVVALEDGPPPETNASPGSGFTDVPDEEPELDEQANDFFANMNIKFDSEDAYSILFYVAGAVVVLSSASIIVGAIDTIPVFPKLMEVVGLGYSFWFTIRYLLFKKNRDELAAKIEELKQQIFGSDD